MSDKDLVDRIDELVDESLSRPITDDYNRDRYPKCGHCGRSWHGIALTQRIADMYAQGRFDESYRVDTDDSEILCHGSDFIGPMKAPGHGGVIYTDTVNGVRYSTGSRGGWLNQIMETYAISDEGLRLDVRAWFGSVIRQHTQQRWWRTQLPDNTTVIQNMEYAEHNIGDRIVDGDLENHTVTIQIGEDSETFNAENVRSRVDHDHDYVSLAHPRRRAMTNTTLIVDVLQELPPRIGGTWVPLTAPGVTGHPSDRYGVPDVEELRAAGWRDLGVLRDDGVTFAAPWVVYIEDEDDAR